MNNDIVEYATTLTDEEFNSKQRFYHVSEDKYEIGQDIVPNNYQEKLGEEQKEIEEDLERYRIKKHPNKPQRATALYAFVQLSDAYHFLEKHGGYLYEVLVNKNDVSQNIKTHVGDMAIIELMKVLPECMRKTLIALYWNSDLLYKPCIEVLTDKLTVSDIVISDERKPKNRSENFHSYNLENHKEYLKLLKRMTNM